MSEGKRSSKAKDDEAVRQELRRFKNREAARRVRERKSNQLNTYKNQVDELKRENQKLLQIIQQLQDASLSGGLALSDCEPSSTQPGHDASGGLAADSADDSNPTGPHAAALAAAGAAAGPPDGMHGQLAWAATLSPRTCGGNPEADSHCLQAATPSDSGLASWPNCVMSQPAHTGVVAMHSSPLPGTFSAPLALGHAGASSSFVPPSPRAFEQHASVQLLRSCGCKDDQECAECEGVRVTLGSSSSLPLVTTPGPRPKRLTLEDLRVPVRRFFSADANATSTSPKAGSQSRQVQHLSGSQHQLKPDLACMDLVQTLEPSKGSSRQQQQQQQQGAAANGHSSTGNTVASVASPRAMQQLLAASSGQVCYVRKSAVSRSPSSTAAAAAAAAASASGLAAVAEGALVGSMDLCCKPEHEQQQEQGKHKLRRKGTSFDTASAAAAAAAAAADSGSFGATELSDNNADVSNLDGDISNGDELLGYFPCSRSMVQQLAALHQNQEQQHHLELQQQPVGVAAMAIDPPSISAAGAAGVSVLHPQQQQQQQQHLQQQIAAARGGGKAHKAPKLLRSIAAAMNGWVRSNSGSLKAAGAAAGPPAGLVARSASATAVPGPQAQQQQLALAHLRHASDPAAVAPAAAGQGSLDASAAAVAAAAQQQQLLLAPLQRGGGPVCLPQECQHQPLVHLEHSLFLGSLEPPVAAAARSNALLHDSSSSSGSGNAGLRPPALSWPCNSADAGAWQAAQQQQLQQRGGASAATSAAAAAAVGRSVGPLFWGPGLQQQQVGYLPAGCQPAAVAGGRELLLDSLRAMEEDGPVLQQDQLQQDPLDDPVMMLALQEGILLVEARPAPGSAPCGLVQ